MSKDYEIHIRLEQRTRDALIQAASRDQKSEKPNISKYIRKMVLEQKESTSQAVALELHALRNQMIRIGNNINQIARIANETGKMEESEKLCEYLMTLYQMFDALRSSISAKGEAADNQDI